jgi:serine/threonine-protein kinase
MTEDPDTPKRTVFIRRDDPQPPPVEPPPMAYTAPPAGTIPPGGNSGRFGAVGSLVGATLNDNYEVTRYIAQGGMGEIYEGRQIRGNVKVAIKVILPQFAADPEFYKLLEREADLLATLGHDAIVKFRGLSHDPRSQLDYLTLEYVQGPSLEDQMDVGAIDPQSCRSLLRRLASGLDAAHDKGVYHRDLSPDNVLLRDGKIERATIIDFGIAKDADASKKTVIGAGFGGKLGFAAPEAFGLFGREIGPWTDIYSLALVVAAAARGKAIDMGTATPIDAIQARQTVPSLDGIEPWLAAVLARMLVPDPASRLRSMAEVIAAVDSLPPIGTPFDAAAADTMASAQFGRQRETTAPPGFATTIPPFSGLEGRRGTTDVNFVRADAPVAAAPPPAKSKLPLFIGGGVALAAVAGIAIMMGGKSTPETPTDAAASGGTEVAAPAAAPEAAPAVALDWAAARAALAAIPCSDVRAAPPAPGVTALVASGWMPVGTSLPASVGGFRLETSGVKTISPAPAAETCAIIGRLRKAAGDSGVQGSLQFSGPTNWKISQLERNGSNVKVPLGVGRLVKEVFIVAIADGQGRVSSAPLPSGLAALPYAPNPQRNLQFFVSAPQTPEKGSETGSGTAIGKACTLGCETASGWVIIEP